MCYKLKCISCNKIYEKNEIEYTCPKCGDIYGTLEVIYDYENINIKKTDFNKYDDIWQFQKILPIEKNSYKVSLKVGGNPLYNFKNLKGIKNVKIKYSGTNPTASYKDRASALAINKAYEKKYDTIYCASTGNAASSLAGLTANTDLKTYIFLPSTAPKAKITQIKIYGSFLIPINTSYDIAYDLSLEIGALKKWYSRNSAYNPYLLEGKKTGALEIIVQNDYNVPDYIIVSVGDGTIISSIYKGFYDFYQLNLINKIPKIIGVQAEKAQGIKKIFDKGEPYKQNIIQTTTIADSISVGNPRDLIKACIYIKKCKGKYISVTDEEIIDSIYDLAKTTGLFAEPAGSAAYAGFSKMINNNEINKNDNVCLIITGNGLKDIDSIKDRINYKTVKPIKKEILDYIENN